jgi:SAM-dependent methyltransferase
MFVEVIKLGAVAVVCGYLMRQVRKPSRWVGRFFVKGMNASHAPLTDWGVSHVEIGKQWNILDVGCGGGRTLGELAKAADAGKIYGVDYAEGSLAASRDYNRQLIAEGRVHIEQAIVSKLPFADCAFELVTAIETQYYWPNLQEDMREIRRVLKPGGKLLVIAENYKGGRFDWLEGPLMRFLLGSSRLGPGDQRALFEGTGYADVQVIEERKKGWICVTGTKL